MRLPDGRVVPRVLHTMLWVPPGAGPFPLVVFAHGFDITPAPYAAMLRWWAHAGFVVAAPVFPRTSPGAPGGPDEGDLVNQPGDLSAVITWLIRASRARTGAFHHLVDPHAVAVAGQSDGAITALLSSVHRGYRDRRVRAGLILSGAVLSSLPGYAFGPGGPPLLVAQGTADRTNLPRYGYGVFDDAVSAREPAFLLRLLGAGHLPPYTTEQPELGVVQRVTTDFLRVYLTHTPGALPALERDGDVAGVAALTARP
jgi:dienelactone hydrolase